MKERGPRPAPEQQDPILNWARQEDTLSRILTRPASIYERVGLGELRKRLEQAHSQTSNLLRETLVEEAKEFVVFEAPKPQTKKSQSKSSKEPGFGAIAAAAVRGLEKRRSRERKEKSRGLHDPRSVEFVFPSGDKVRGKEGKIIKLLSKAKNRTLNKEQLFGQVYPGIRPQKAGELLNRSARSARKHALRNGKDIVAKRDYEKKTTNYSLVDRPKRKKKH